MNEVVTLHFFGTLRLLFSAYLFFFWIPRRVFPGEYIENARDRVMFNITHMTALITLVFPLFIYLRVFGFLFVILFFPFLRLMFIKYWYKKELIPYLRDEVYHALVIGILKVLDDRRAYFASRREKLRQALRSRPSWDMTRLLAGAAFALILGAALHLRLSRAFTTLVAAASDMYQYFYWNNILKLNRLFDKVAGAPYPWGAPVLVYTVNLFARLNTVVLHNAFPLLILSFTLYGLFYCARGFLDRDGKGCAAPLIAVLTVGILIPTPLAESFFGTVFVTEKPELLHVPLLGIFRGTIQTGDQIAGHYPLLFFIRGGSMLPYEISAAFFLPNLYFLHRTLESGKKIWILLYAETLAVMLALHPGVALPLLPPTLLILAAAPAWKSITRESLRTAFRAVSAALLLGNLWILQFFVYGIPADIGAAAPFLDALFRTKRAEQQAVAHLTTEVQILSPGWLPAALLAASLILLLYACFRGKGERRPALAPVSLISLGVLCLYAATNLGLPRIVDHSRLQPFVALSYGLVSASLYQLLLEKALLARIAGRYALRLSYGIVCVLAVFLVVSLPRWEESEEYWQTTRNFELNETPYYLYEIEETFQPFSYTVVSYAEGFSQVYSKGYHINTQDFLRTYSPLETSLRIPTDYVFIFVENAGVGYRGMWEYWYRWRNDIMTHLKDWIALYGRNHSNMKLWAESKSLQVFVIDNRNSRDILSENRRKMKEGIR